MITFILMYMMPYYSENHTSSRPFVASTIIGATSVEQLRENAEAFAMEWTPEMEKDVDAIFRIFKDPAKNP